MAVTARQPAALESPARPRGAEAGGQPVKVWAFFGGAILAFQIYIWTRWITGPNFKRVPAGPNQPPEAMKIAIWSFLSVGFVLAAASIWWFVIRPWRRERRFSLDGMLCVSFALAYFQDPLFNYSGTWLTYNSWMPNWGSWLSEMPGSLAPHHPGAQFAESPLWVLPLFTYILLPVSLLIGWVMGRCRRRWPTLTRWRQFLIGWAFAGTFTLVLEAAVLMPIGFYTYAGAAGSLSVNPSHYYKYPVYEAVAWGALWAVWACLRCFRDDRGETLPERGISELHVGPRRRTAIRFLAVFGAVSVAFLCVYNIPAQYFALHAQPFPRDVQRRSYFLDGLCRSGRQRCSSPVHLHPIRPG
jgi:Spirocyclase AveC-like